MLFGLHVARGEIDLSATLATLAIDDLQGLTDAEKQATVLQLLQSRSGVYHPAAYETLSAAAARPARGSHAPGAFWYYNNWDFNTLATIFRRRTGRTVFEAFDADLAAPLQFEDFRVAEHARWHRERVSEHPAYLIDLSARDLARLGLLMARGGRWGEREIVPAGWVTESTRAHSALPGGWQAYGLMWWTPQRAWPFWQRAPGDVFFGSGNYGQFVIADRARDLVIVHRTDGPSWRRRAIDAEGVSPLLAALLAAAP
jgi:CubicO group peptidase (beta-lactamase class C family)